MHLRHSILVPVLDGDITPTVFADACEALARRDARHDARLVLLHVRRDDAPRARRADAPAADAPEPDRALEGAGGSWWRRLADQLPADRVLVDAETGDPSAVIAACARRYHADVVGGADGAGRADVVGPAATRPRPAEREQEMATC